MPSGSFSAIERKEFSLVISDQHIYVSIETTQYRWKDGISIAFPFAFLSLAISGQMIGSERSSSRKIAQIAASKVYLLLYVRVHAPPPLT